MRLVLVLCVMGALGRAMGDETAKSDTGKFNLAEEDDKMVQRIEEEMLLLNKSKHISARDKRALGIILQGFLESLGYTVSPIQLASLPNGNQTMQMAAGSSPAAAAMATTTPRQRETLRFTGVLNFGNNVDTSNVVSHLAQYENLFHGNRSNPRAAAPPRPPSGPPQANIDPRSHPDPPEPLFVKIPLPIAPNLPPSAMPMSHDLNYQQEDSAEEYDEGKKGDSEEYENNSGEYSEEPEEQSNYSGGNNSQEPKSVEKQYQANKNSVSYSVENRPLHHPSQVSKPAGDAYRKQQEAHAEREQGRDESEEDAEYHRSREKEIAEKNERQEARYGEQPYYDDEEDAASKDEEYDEVPSGASQYQKRKVTVGEGDAKLPIGYDRESKRPDQPLLRDSYGEILEKPHTKPDERVASYFTMFKNPNTGVYDPRIIQQYETTRNPYPYDYLDLEAGFKGSAQKEYGSKYEEYEISPEADGGEGDDKAAKQEQKASAPARTPTAATIPESYGPYYSSFNYLYEPLDYDQSIIARLTATTPRFEEQTHPTERSSMTTAGFLHHEPEIRQIAAWPAPFADYAFDNSEQRQVFLSSELPPPPPTTTTKCWHEHYDRRSGPARTQHYPAPLEQRKRLVGLEKPIGHADKNRVSTRAPTTSAPFPRKRARTATQRIQSRPKESGQQQIARPNPSEKASSNYIEKGGVLFIPEPTPYYYNERIDELPDVDAGKVKIKEYRNSIASVKVSELKQLHPEGSTQILTYSRHL